MDPPTYNAANQLTNWGGTNLTYDVNGNLTRFTDRKEQATNFTYDALNRRTQATYADTSTTTYTYDAGNRLTQIVDSVSGTITLTYDNLDRLTQETTPQGTVSYTYDAAGRRTSMTVAGQPMVNYTYDNANRLTQITQSTNTATFAYDAAGRRTSVILPNGIVEEYTYDAASRFTEIQYKQGSTVVGNLIYTYDAAGNRTQIGGTWARTGLPQAVTSATYNANNQMVTFGAQSLTYDLNGNLTSDGTTSYTWDARNRMASLTGPGTTASFQYDPLGRRVNRTVGGTTTSYLYDGQNPVQELSGATPTANLLTGLGVDQYFTRTDAFGTETLLTDALGSTMALADNTGTVQTQYTYEPFGKTTATGATSTNPFQYTGRENDGTGLYYYRARYYSPSLQRFISEDPIGITGGINLYRYGGNNPVRFGDPFGFCRIEVRFSRVSGVAYHSYIITTDPSGSQNYYRGGPANRSSGASSSGASSSSSGSLSGRKDAADSVNSPWGPIRTQYGPYRPGTPDWDPGQPPSIEILNNNEACGPYDQRFAQSMQDIANENIPYRPFTTNSNAVAAEALEQSGFNPGTPPGWTPGWGTPLP